MPANDSEYLKDINELKQRVIDDLEDLLEFSTVLAGRDRIGRNLSIKTAVTYNIFSALHQRALSVIKLAEANQGTVANIVVRSMLETIADYEYMYLERSNKNIQVRLAHESNQQLTNWRSVKELRRNYPQANTWQNIISDDDIERTIQLRQSEVDKTKSDYPDVDLRQSSRLLSRLKEIDDYNVAKNSNHKDLWQFNYRTIYSILSSDTHSTLVGNMGNSRWHRGESLEIRLDSPPYEAVRALTEAFRLMLAVLQELNKRKRLNSGGDLAQFRKRGNSHSEEYHKLQSKYDF